ncbi:MAG: hypothetical protein AB1Z98_01615 [Nannocystaceae bacterium]
MKSSFPSCVGPIVGLGAVALLSACGPGFGPRRCSGEATEGMLVLGD